MMLRGDRGAGAAVVKVENGLPWSGMRGMALCFQAQCKFEGGEQWFIFDTHREGWLFDIEFLWPRSELPLSLVEVVWDGVDHDGSIGLKLPRSERMVPSATLMEVRVDGVTERCYVSLGMPTPCGQVDHGVRRLEPEPELLARCGLDIAFDVDSEMRLVGVEMADYRKSLPLPEIERATILPPGEPLRPWETSEA